MSRKSFINSRYNINSQFFLLVPILIVASYLRVHNLFDQAYLTLDDQYYSQWGIGDNSAAVEIRFQNTTEQGTKYTDGSLLLIGDLEPGGEAYYGKSAEEGITQPVLLFPKIWVETLLGIYDDIPYAQ